MICLQILKGSWAGTYTVIIQVFLSALHWQCPIDSFNHFEVIMQKYAEWAPRGTVQNAFCRATVWSRLPSGARYAP